MGALFSTLPACGEVCICSAAAGAKLPLDMTDATSSRIKLLLIGLDNAGKTTTVMRLLGRPIDDVVPTIGFSNIEMKQINKFTVEIYDLGGGAKIRDIWKNYFALVHGVIYVVDSTDEDRIPEIKANLENVIQHEKISKKPILVLINKQDVEGAVEEVDISKQLNLSVLANTYQCPTRIESTSATANYDVGTRGVCVKDDGVQAGYVWLVNHIIKHWPALSERVQNESREQVEQERELMRQRYERFRNGTLSPPGLVDDGEDESSHENPFKPIHEAVLVADLKAEQQNKDSKVPLRAFSKTAIDKSNPDVIRTIPAQKTAIPGKRDRSKTKIIVEPKKKVLIRKTVLRNSNKITPITR